MTAPKWLVWTVALASLSGCFSYVPAELATIPSGQGVRVFLNREGMDRLADLGVAELAEVNEPVVAGTLLRREDGRLALRIPVMKREIGMLQTGIAQEITFPAGEFVRVDRRRFDGFRTGLAAAGAVGAATAVIVLIIKGGGGDQLSPLPGGSDDIRIPVVPVSIR